ncbi:MAG TPA: hypothetical protein VN698_13805 [Bacteroidia bacterium]|nr:hypothetical protein [Bacteroidia bacterium]
MKKLSLLFGLALAFVGCNNTKTPDSTGTVASDTTGLPYTVKVEEIIVSALPDLHSYTHAIYQDKIVMFGGRTSGLHTFNYVFQTTRSNTTIYVIDTKNWADPTTWTVDSMPDSKISFAGKQPYPVSTSRFHANNAEFFTKDSILYLIGGLLSTDNSTENPKTLNYFTAIDLPTLISTVKNGGKPMRPNAIRQALILNDSTKFSITGGEISVMNDTVYLVFGWNFYGSNDYYSHQVKKFTFTDNGSGLTVGPMTSWSDGHANGLDADTAGAFRRRDGSMSQMIDPANGSNMLLYYGGVFKQGYNYYTTPVWINGSGATEQNFNMRSNIYTCQVIPVYSSSRKESYATLLGGMKNATFTNTGSAAFPVELNATNAPLLDTVGRSANFSYAPFTNQFTTIRIDANHSFSQYLLADSFPVIAKAYTLPGSASDPNLKDTTINAGSVMYTGSESEMHWNLNKKYLMSNGVVNYDALMADSTNGASVGYLHGGILSLRPNILTTSSFHYSVASNRLFRVKIVPLKK